MTGRTSPYGAHEKRRRRRSGRDLAPAATAVSDGTTRSASRSICSYEAFSVYVMLSLAAAAACLTESLLVRIAASMVRRIFPFSTLTQFFAAGTNQLRRAARSPTLLVFRRLVAFGMLPAAWNAFSDVVLVKAAIQSAASCLL